MTASLLIVFREVLEAALIISIIAAVTKGVPSRSKWMLGGIGAGVLGAIIVALFADQIADLAEGVGQEIFNAGVLFAAVALLSWHNVWMAKHGREIAQHVGKVGREVKDGAEPLYALTTVIAVAVLREGSEVVLFLYGISAAGSAGTDMALGSAIGLALGAALGFVLYFGLLRIPLRYFFSATSWLILLLAAGMAANGANYLNQADVLPALGYGVWDTSWLLSDQSVLGGLLHVLVGYSAEPSGIQVLFYFATILIVGGLMLMTNKKTVPNIGKKASAILSAIGLGATLFPAQSKAGPPKVYSPIVEKGELELEHRGILDDDNEAGFIFEVGYGVTNRWFTSVFVETEKAPWEPFKAEAIAFENIFQLTEQGQYFVDVGIYLEYEAALETNHADKFEGKILLEKTTGRFVHTANLIFEHEVGKFASPGTGFEVYWQTRYLYRPYLEFGFQAFSEFGDFGSFGPLSGQEHRIGPAIFGKKRIGKKMFFAYEAAYLIGLNKATPNAFRWLLELEAYF